MTTIKKPHRWDNEAAINGPQVVTAGDAQAEQTISIPHCFGSNPVFASAQLKTGCFDCKSRTECVSVSANNPEPTTSATTIRNINDILEERGARYGDFMTVASFSQQIKSLLCSAEPFLPLDPDMIEALEMISNKLARMLCGDPTYIENWRDIAGYATLVMNRLSQTNGATDSVVHNVTIGCESDYSRGTKKD